MTGSETQNYTVLSERELQIVELVASGLTNQDIADTLEISKRTVDNHISNILQKTGTGNRVALFRWALNWGKVCIDNVNCCRLPELPAASPAIAPAANPAISPGLSERPSPHPDLTSQHREVDRRGVIRRS